MLAASAFVVLAAEPLYVVALRAESNEVVLGPEAELLGTGADVRAVNWVSRGPIDAPIDAQVKVRYSHEAAPARIEPAPLPDDPGAVRVRFEQPVRAITPGQSAVFYDGEEVVGGGWISKLPD